MSPSQAFLSSGHDKVSGAPTAPSSSQLSLPSNLLPSSDANAVKGKPFGSIVLSFDERPVSAPAPVIVQGVRPSLVVPLTHEWDAETQILVLKCAIKCADLGHLTSTEVTHRKWVSLLEEEMFRQGDKERAQGLPISPLMDRRKGGVTKSQTGFFNLVAIPLYEAFSEVFTETREVYDNLMVNYRMWEVEEKAHAAKTSESNGN